MFSATTASPVRTLSTLAQAIALPHEHEASRYPSFPALERTAVMSFNSPTTTSFNSTKKGILMRQASYPLWFERETPKAMAYGITYTVESNAPNAFPINEVTNCNVQNRITGALFNSVTNGEGPILSCVAGFDTTANYISPLMGQDLLCGPQPFVYCTKNAAFVLSASTAFGAAIFNVNFELWQAPGSITTYSAAKIGAPSEPWATITASTCGGLQALDTLKIPGNENCWIRPVSVQVQPGAVFNLSDVRLTLISGTIKPPTYTTSATTRGTVVVLNGDDIGPWLQPAAYPSEYYNSSIPWNSTRLTAVGVCFTNCTSVMNKEGTCLAGRITPSTTSVWSVQQSYIQSLHPSEKSLMSLENGFYTYCPPTTDMATFYDYSFRDTGFIFTCPVVRLDNDAMANVFFFSDPSSVATPTSMAINLDWHIEFRTTSALFQLGVSSLTLEVYHQTLIMLMTHGYFFSNFDHIKLLRMLLKGGKAVAGAFAPKPIAMAINYGLDYADRKLSNKPGPIPKTNTVKVAPTYSRPIGPPTYKQYQKQQRKQGVGRQVPSRPPHNAPKPAPLNGKRQGGLNMYLKSVGRK